jgi:hypothetical protein
MYFSSKKDLWITIIAWLFAFLFIVPPVFYPDLGVWMTPDFVDRRWIKMIFLFPIGFCLIWIWFKTGYIIADNILKIQYGPFKKIIKIDDIHSIRKTRNPFTDPALSMDKIEINYARFKTIAISPKNKHEFVRQLLKQNPNIKYDNYLEDSKES